ncbi:MAG: hypothetical protein WB562_06115 [Candidatus Sulfotelmatobacter sp.]
MTPQDYSIASQGYFMRHSRQLEGHRMIAYVLMSINKKKGKSLPSPAKLWPLLTDRINEDIDKENILSREDAIKIFETRFKQVQWQEQTKD